ncbi:MAG: SpoIID/LytB domain-containing protein [Deltaproteobacteria bacterium]|nr:SpoIID/LytB domain-containing protein [Deltaproteobacteria bacterium]
MLGIKRVLPFAVFTVAFVVFYGCAAGSRVAMSHGGEPVRVLVLDSLVSVTVDDSQLGKSVTVELFSGGEATIAGKKTALPVRFKPVKYILKVEGRPYRGIIEVREGTNGKLIVINEVPVEAYVVGIINNEISSKWNIEAIKAQAVVSRTYVLYQKEKRKGAAYDVASTVMDQVYSGAGKEDSASSKAVKLTEGQVLLYDGRPALTLFHSSAGGRTENSGDVWGDSHDYLRSVKSKYDEDAPNYEWELKVSKTEIAAALNKIGVSVEGVSDIEVEEETRSDRAKVLAVTDDRGRTYYVSGEDLRKALGYSKLKSTLFEVDIDGDAVVFEGRGSGHGVGMSQWGAKGMADAGYSYKKILDHYYPGTRLKKVY